MYMSIQHETVSQMIHTMYVLQHKDAQTLCGPGNVTLKIKGCILITYKVHLWTATFFFKGTLSKDDN